MNVLLHGFTGSPASWETVLSGPSAALTLVGHGGPLSESFAWEVERLADAIDAIDAAPVNLIGYSMGARLALGIACKYPNLVERLVLIGVHPGIEDGAAREQRTLSDETWCRLLEDSGIDAFVEAWEGLSMWDTQKRLDASVQARQRAIRRSHDPHELAHALRVAGLAAMPSLWPRLSSVRAPVQLVCGATDNKFRAIAERASAAFPRASLELIANAGHNLILEAPQQIAAIIEKRSN